MNKFRVVSVDKLTKLHYNKQSFTLLYQGVYMMKLTPLSDRVVVRRVDAEAVTKGGIFIPDAAAEKADQGTVLAVGPGKRTDAGVLFAPGVSEGDRVLFGKFSGQSVKIDGEELLILKEEDILGVITQ